MKESNKIPNKTVGEKKATIDQEIIRVKAIWDNEARVWVATSDDVPGLITESEHLEDLVQKLKILIPELLEANGVLKQAGLPKYF